MTTARVLAIVLVLAGCADGSAWQRAEPDSNPICSSATVVAALDTALMEVSGIARDPRRSDLFWLHNDSGNDPILFAVDSTGRLLGSAPISRAAARDVEDLAIGRCGETWCAYVGDIGDNLAAHSSITVQRVEIPPLDALGGPSTVRLEPLEPLDTWKLVFPDGPRDAEGLVFDDLRGEIGIISKGREDEVVLYGASLSELESGSEVAQALTRVGRLPVEIGSHSSQLVTGADLSADRNWLALRSYASLHFIPWHGALDQDTTAEVLTVSLLGALEPQGEGVTWSADGEVLWLASEGRGGRPPQLSRIRCPASSR
ncbi:MAG: hypothetical protein M8857_09915 [marine benthic group bacterium]|nr:hypothetical protein [Gemmatimonadota bacterium]MCL7964944.1 hypothetical protein [Gemmatimonadota bacterium]MCL7967417.1 hypothetical protein [Gemmatimonadota bacterium]MCL7970303.1 hypothetical protein [Gemmatimonadota bacterium]MCL7978905.1 hypothetical protein [Gemmatimonadota bacterium]